MKEKQQLKTVFELEPQLMTLRGDVQRAKQRYTTPPPGADVGAEFLTYRRLYAQYVRLVGAVWAARVPHEQEAIREIVRVYRNAAGYRCVGARPHEWETWYSESQNTRPRSEA